MNLKRFFLRPRIILPVIGVLFVFIQMILYSGKFPTLLLDLIFFPFVIFFYPWPVYLLFVLLAGCDFGLNPIFANFILTAAWLYLIGLILEKAFLLFRRKFSKSVSIFFLLILLAVLVALQGITFLFNAGCGFG